MRARRICGISERPRHAQELRRGPAARFRRAAGSRRLVVIPSQLRCCGRLAAQRPASALRSTPSWRVGWARHRDVRADRGLVTAMQTRQLRVGIDVGGTFTDVVAIDAATRELVASVKVPTTHGAPQGVAAGIVAGIERLLLDPNVSSSRVAFIAHSTTQATNALLEGDLARVGVLGLLDGFGWLSQRQIRFGAVPLGSGASFDPTFAFASAHDEEAIRRGV